MSGKTLMISARRHKFIVFLTKPSPKSNDVLLMFFMTFLVRMSTMIIIRKISGIKKITKDKTIIPPLHPSLVGASHFLLS